MYALVNLLVILCYFNIIIVSKSNAISDKSQYKANDDLLLVDGVSVVVADDDDDDDDVLVNNGRRKAMEVDNIIIDNDSLSLENQVRLLSKQMSALMERRREDYKLLEDSLKKSVRKNSMEFGDIDLRTELNQLR